MAAIIVSNAGQIASGLADISTSIFRIVDSNNWTEAELFRIAKETEVVIKKIKCEAKFEKAEIDYCYKQIITALNSSMLDRNQKKQFFQIMIDTMEKV